MTQTHYLTHYFEIKAIPQAEMTQNAVMSHLFKTVHPFLPQFKGEIGVSFPGYGQHRTAGGILRLFGNEAAISKLNRLLYQEGNIRDYALLSLTQAIPQERKEYATFSRVRFKGASDVRRAEKRLKAQGQWTKKVEERLLEKWSVLTKLPYLEMKSLSNKQTFSLWIERKRQKEEVLGTFNSYGLSKTTTVPIF